MLDGNRMPALPIGRRNPRTGRVPVLTGCPGECVYKKRLLNTLMPLSPGSLRSTELRNCTRRTFYHRDVQSEADVLDSWYPVAVLAHIRQILAGYRTCTLLRLPDLSAG